MLAAWVVVAVRATGVSSRSWGSTLSAVSFVLVSGSVCCETSGIDCWGAGLIPVESKGRTGTSGLDSVTGTAGV